MNTVTKTLTLIIIIIISLYGFSNSINERTITVTRTNNQGITIKETTTQSIIKTESLIKTNNNPSFYLLSTKPIKEEEEPTIIVTSNIRNYYDETIKLTKATIKKNDKTIITKNHRITIKPGDTYKYETNKINPKGKESQKNTIKIIFELTGNKKVYEQTYIYEYLQLTTCNNNNECQHGTTCDYDNIAGLSNNHERYCAITCDEKTPCPKEQECYNHLCKITR